MNNKIVNKSKLIKASVKVLELLLLVLIIYLITLPFYPEIQYRLSLNNQKNYKDIETIVKETNTWRAQLPSNSDKTISISDEKEPILYPNGLIISKIGVNSPIIVTENESYGLSLGSLLIPSSSRPHLGGNTVITGHRFRYLPPNNLTLYLLHKLEIDDIFLVVWQNKDYYYRVKDIKIVEANDNSPNKESSEPILTIYTCHPIYSTAKRLVVVSELVLK